ncbi:MAG: flagellar hook-basal body complex protein, partial [bacterium]|nr:flagellar hook-basal body complex protein [bacterium]
MFQAFYTGITGIKTYQKWVDVISHNVANTQTIGYKKERVIFEEMLSHRVKHAYTPRDGRGGENGKEIGTGVQNAKIQSLYTQGSIEDTGKDTDLAIIGEGFFIMKDVECHLKHYTRAGAFDFDADGNLVNPSDGFHVQGFLAERDSYGRLVIGEDNNTIINTTKNLQNIKVIEKDKMLGKATRNITLSSNLNKDQDIAIDPIKIKLTAPAVSTEEVVTTNFGYDSDGVYVYQDEHKNWRYRDGRLAVKPDTVRNELDTSKSFKDAGWDRVPDGTVTINGAVFNLDDYETVDDFISAVNDSTEANVTMSYDPIRDKWTIKNDLPGVPLELSDNPKTVSFFEEANIITGKIEPKEIRIEFMHLLDPQNQDKRYYRFTPVDAKTGEAITPQVMSKEEIITGSGTLDLSQTPVKAFLVDNPEPTSTITINDYTSRPLSEYASLEALFTEINNSEKANAIISYDAKKDRVTIRSKVPGVDLRVSETEKPERTGVDIKGQFLDEVDAYGKMDGKLVGKVEGTVRNNGEVTGVTIGKIYAKEAKGKIEGHFIGDVDGNVEGRGMYSGDAVFFKGKIKGVIAEKDIGIRGDKKGSTEEVGLNNLDTTLPFNTYVKGTTSVNNRFSNNLDDGSRIVINGALDTRLRITDPDATAATNWVSQTG